MRTKVDKLAWIFLLAIMVAAFFVPARADIVDKTVATVSDGVRTELITYSDLMWQLALEPGVPLNPPLSADLGRALKTLIEQRLFALEAERLPRTAPTDEAINAQIAELISYFPSAAEFERRLNLVGFKSVKDENFQRIISQRLAIEQYLDFRFRSFVVITGDDEAKYYRDIYVPDFRRRYPGVLVPTLESKRADIRKTLVEERVAAQIDTFLEEAKRRTEIVTLSPV